MGRNAADIIDSNLHNQKQQRIGYYPPPKNGSEIGKANPYGSASMALARLMGMKKIDYDSVETDTSNPDLNAVEHIFVKTDKIPSGKQVTQMLQKLREANTKAKPFYDAQKLGFEQAEKFMQKFPRPKN